MRKKLNCIDVKKIVLHIVIFFISFIIIGDSYILFLDIEVFNSDYIYQTDTLDNKEIINEYIKELDNYSKEFNLHVYLAKSKVDTANDATYTIYSFDDDKSYLKEKLQISKDSSSFRSFISGNRKVFLKSIDEISEINDNYYFYVYGDLKDVKQLRSLTIDKYGMTRPVENHRTNDAVIIVYGVLIFVSFIIIIQSIIQINYIKREVLVRCLNGLDKTIIILKLICKNVLEITISVISGCFLSGFITNMYRFVLIISLFIAFQILFSSILFLSLNKINVQKTLSRSYYPNTFKFFSFLSMTVISIVLIITLSYNVKNIIDSVKTISQQNNWNNFSEYSTLMFFSKEENENANQEKDTEYSLKLYNEYVDKYNIYTSMDLKENGANNTFGIDDTDNSTYVYINLNAADQLENLGIVELDELEKEKYYIISRFSDSNIREKVEDNIYYIFDDENINDYNIISVNKDFSFLVYDINIANLADNYKKNPIIILDTHTKITNESLAFIVFNSLVKVNQDDYYEYIKNIGYENEVYYISKVMDIYNQKKDQKMLMLVINIILSFMVLVMYCLTLSSVLKMEFNCRAIEIVLDKIFGKNLLCRYKKVFIMLASSYFIGVILTLLLKLVLYSFSIINIIIASIILIFFSGVILYAFINRYERINIQKILKGGL